MVSWSWQKEKESMFLYCSFCPNEFHLTFVFYLNVYIVYGIRFQNIHTFTYQKTLLHTRFLFLKFLEVLSVSLRTTVIAKPQTSGILFSTSPIFVFKTAIVTKPLMSGILFLISPIFISKFCYLCCIGLFELK